MPEALRKKFAQYEQNLRDIGFWATVTRLADRVERGLKKVQTLGAISLAALLLLAWAANPPKKDDGPAKPSIVQVVTSCASCPVGQPMPAARKVTFANDSHELDGAAYAVLNEAAAMLRQQPTLGVLLLAHTDMVATHHLNRALAARRAAAVRRALQDQGGVTPSRVFASELAKTDLPVVTGPEVAQPENRSVELLFVPLPLPAR